MGMNTTPDNKQMSFVHKIFLHTQVNGVFFFISDTEHQHSYNTITVHWLI